MVARKQEMKIDGLHRYAPPRVDIKEYSVANVLKHSTRNTVMVYYIINRPDF